MKSGQDVATFHGATNVRNMGDGPKSFTDYVFNSVPVSSKSLWPVSQTLKSRWTPSVFIA